MASVWASIFCRPFFTFSSKVLSRAAIDVGCFGRASSPIVARSNRSTSHVASSQCGMLVMCAASWPRLNDLSCGFHARSASGTRSSSRRVVPISWSYSGSSASLRATGEVYDGGRRSEVGGRISVVTQRRERVDARCTAGRQVGGGESHRQEERGRTGEGRGIVGLHAEQLALDQPTSDLRRILPPW